MIDACIMMSYSVQKVYYPILLRVNIILYKQLTLIMIAGSDLYLPPVRNNSPVWIRKIRSVWYASEVVLVTEKELSKEEGILCSQQVRQLLYSDFPLGAPFTLKVGSSVYLPSKSGPEKYEVTAYRLGSVANSCVREKSMVSICVWACVSIYANHPS